MDILLESGWANVGNGVFELFAHEFDSVEGGTYPSPYFGLLRNGFSIEQAINVPSSANGREFTDQNYNNVITPGSATWTNITVVADGTYVNLYVNGVAKTNFTGELNTSGIKWNTGSWSWGGLSPSTTAAGLVKMRNFYWWSNKALSSTEILQFIQR
jgi:hypothetical protein